MYQNPVEGEDNWVMRCLLHQTPAEGTNTWKLWEIRQLKSASNWQFRGEIEYYWVLL